MGSAYETVTVRAYRARCHAVASRIGALSAIGMTADDAASEFQIAVVMACRYWERQSDDAPPDSYINCAIRRTRGKLYAQIQRALARGEAEDVAEHTQIADDKPDPEQTTQSGVDQITAAQWEAVLATVLSPKEIALLRLRALGWTNREIAKQIAGDNQRIKKQVWRAKHKARDFLKGLGIDTLDAALSVDSTEIEEARQTALNQ